MVKAIRNIELALGDGVKRVSKSEMLNLGIVRKSIVARVEILKGDILSVENLAIKRPGTGVSPMRWYEVLGSKAKKSFKADDLII
jgi:N,N'-diacetyllegionaminate synthase